MAAYRVDAVAALADPTRRAIVERLATGPIAVGELARGLPVSRPAVSQHLRVLEEVGLVIVRPVGTRRLYQLDPAGVDAIRAYFEQLWQQSLAAFKAAADEQEDKYPMVEQVMIAPITHNLRVNVPMEQAFELFTAGFGSWWPAEHHIGEEPCAEIVIEPHADGRWFERDAAGTECDWGRVLTWDPPRGLVLAWQLGPDWRFDPDLDKASEIEVRFTPEGDGATQVVFTHRGFERRGEAGASIRESVSGDGGWGYCLSRFVEATANS